MIKIINGDLLYAKENIIGHQVNCQGVMGSGVARQIRDKYPLVYKKYIKKVNESMLGEDLRKELLGFVQGVIINPNQVIANMFAQFDYGSDGNQYTDTEALFKCFKEIRRVAEENNKSVAFPYMIGCYRGGADWIEVESLLLTAFNGYEVTLYKL